MYLSGHFLTPRFRNFSKLPSGEVKWQYPPYTQKNCLTYIKTIDWIGNHGGKVLSQSWGIARTSDHETKIISILEKHIKSKEDLCEIPSKIVWTCLSESVQTFFPCSIILCFYIKIKYYNFFLFVCRVHAGISSAHLVCAFFCTVFEPGSIGVYFLIRSICIRKGKKINSLSVRVTWLLPLLPSIFEPKTSTSHFFRNCSIGRKVRSRSFLPQGELFTSPDKKSIFCTFASSMNGTKTSFACRISKEKLSDFLEFKANFYGEAYLHK